MELAEMPLSDIFDGIPINQSFTIFNGTETIRFEMWQKDGKKAAFAFYLDPKHRAALVDNLRAAADKIEKPRNLK